MKKALFIIGILLMSISLVSAVSQEDLNEAKLLIDSKVECNKLTNEQLEIIGEYYMEQMMPGEAHKRADEMMGFEDNPKAEEQFHINLAKRSYCGENIGMMGRGMMGNYPRYSSYGYNPFWNILWLILLMAIIILTVWVIYQFTRKRKESKTPLSILQARYAKGEISKKQFEEMKKEIEGDNYGKR